jgi:uncharacterized protein (DUF2252 family)
METDKIPMASLQINESMVKDMVRSAVSSAVVKQFAGADKFIGEIVKQVLDKPVSKDHGGEPRYSSDAMPFIDFITSKSLTAVAKEVLEEFLAERRKEIKAQIRKELSKPARAKSLAVAFINTAEASLKSNWGFTCEIKLDSETAINKDGAIHFKEED